MASRASSASLSAAANPSCDRCRSRKVRCTPLTEAELVDARKRGVGNRCKGCYKAEKECTHDYVHKKPGRPVGSGGSGGRTSTRKTPRLSSTPAVERPPVTTTTLLAPSVLPEIAVADDPVLSHTNGTGPAEGSIFGSARNALYPTYSFTPVPLFDPSLASVPLLPVQNGVGVADSTYGTVATPLLPTTTPASDPPSVPALDIPLTPLTPTDTEYEKGLRLEDALSWTDASFFFKMYLTCQHCLVPLIHKPTFSQDVLKRRDREDESFRGLLYSIIAFTICQCPMSNMTGVYDRPHLVVMLHRCTKAAEAIRHRQRLNPSLPLITSTILDWITAQAVGKPQVCDLLVAETTRLAHALGLNESSPRPGTNTVDVELSRRIYWTIYAKDKTDAMSGRPIILHDFEGVPPHPLETDDEYITTEGALPQPKGKTSTLVGYVAIMRVFQVLAHTINRQRAWANKSSLDPDEQKDPSALRRWIGTAQARLREVIDGLPPALRLRFGASEVDSNGEEVPQQYGDFGIQQANITITALCAEFALLDLRASICPDEDTRQEKEEMAGKAYDTLSSIPIELLASNGESMRGKVLRIILTLLSMTTEPVNFSQNAWEWWNIYSRVQFLQVIPDDAMTLLDHHQANQAQRSPVAV
ncbi:hypothetical protein Q8F55_000306 [Vanrija albida]|uniref:Zn(2)-C6 fungal-type domain-containing protein n=1 Tax=Vanrija albida TaxID=181172 RepID=A0ABR3QCW7_9TREE